MESCKNGYSFYHAVYYRSLFFLLYGFWWNWHKYLSFPLSSWGYHYYYYSRLNSQQLEVLLTSVEETRSCDIPLLKHLFWVSMFFELSLPTVMLAILTWCSCTVMFTSARPAVTTDVDWLVCPLFLRGEYEMSLELSISLKHLWSQVRAVNSVHYWNTQLYPKGRV